MNKYQEKEGDKGKKERERDGCVNGISGDRNEDPRTI